MCWGILEIYNLNLTATICNDEYNSAAVLSIQSNIKGMKVSSYGYLNLQSFSWT